jgi:hypothetical protein
MGIVRRDEIPQDISIPTVLMQIILPSFITGSYDLKSIETRGL